MIQSPIIRVGECLKNELYMKREDLIPFSFGGNKARKAQLFFQKIDAEGYDCVVTYGSGSSNHCRVVANECCRRGLPCTIISPAEIAERTFNSCLTELLGAKTFTVPVSEVHDTILKTVSELQKAGKHPYFIEGGGHGNLGTEAYVCCYREIVEQEKEIGVVFDYFFFASGTGTTQAGLVCGQLLEGDDRKIIGISIARKNPRGRDVVVDSIRTYLGTCVSEDRIQNATIFLDEYTSGYGKDDRRVHDAIKETMQIYGVPMDATYTGKAFMGMTEYLKEKEIKGKNILFIHTGGTPLFFDELNKKNRV